MHRLHEDDLAGHVLEQEPWEVVRLPAIADDDERHQAETVFGRQYFCRRAGEVLHAKREPPEMLEQIRRTLGEYNFAGQYQQAPSPQGGGMVKAAWFRRYAPNERPDPLSIARIAPAHGIFGTEAHGVRAMRSV